MDELIKEFDYHRINKSPSVFDIQKLRWMNGEYFKAMDPDKFYEMALPYIKEVITKDSLKYQTKSNPLLRELKRGFSSPFQGAPFPFG